MIDDQIRNLDDASAVRMPVVIANAGAAPRNGDLPLSGRQHE